MKRLVQIPQLPLTLVPVLMLPVVVGALWLVLQPGRVAPGVLVIAGAVAVSWYLLGGLVAANRVLQELRLRGDLRRVAPDLSAMEQPVWAVGPGGQVLAQNEAAAARLDLVGRPVATLLSQFRAEPDALVKSAIARGGTDTVGTVTRIPVAPLGEIAVRRLPASRLQLWELDVSPDGRDVGLDAAARGLRDMPGCIAPFCAAMMMDLPVALLWLDHDGSIREANTEARNLLGEAVVARRLSALLDSPARSIDDWITDVAVDRPTGRREVLRLIGDDPEKFMQVTLARFEAADTPCVVAVLTDASALKTLEQQFAQSQKMQAIGQLAGGIAHDFNNLLTAITGYCDLLMLRRDKADPDYADLHQIEQNANRAAALVEQLLAFSRKQTLKPQVIDLRDTLSDLTHLLNRLVGERVRLTFTHDPALQSIRADRRQLEQVLMNLVVNARDAMPNGGEVAIRTDNLRLPSGLRRQRVTLPPGNYVRVTVTDQGCGIPEDRLDKIFEPFFTTKRQGEGTGLGLSTAYGIVKQTGGYIFCESVPGEGTTFELYFPVHQARAADTALPISAAGTPAEAVRSGDEAADAASAGAILLVEDEAPVRAFAARALRLRGHEVLEADSAEAALAILSDDRVAVEVFVTDIVMPGMDGPAWVRAALRDRPGTRVVFMSGYTEHSLADGALAIPNSVFLPKPFSLSDLTSCVENQIAGRPAAAPAMGASDLVPA
ncbi:ATP-binding protein [uncultured Paracoccus sp.]|uniref:ATP-binding protein n=1 Tax=uncultured Paracoccus sp. TaxID=189685 RepID=UPI00260445EB|nr:ATP-binding protein [uncultured Paracoccus sp.]